MAALKGEKHAIMAVQSISIVCAVIAIFSENMNAHVLMTAHAAASHDYVSHIA